MWVRSLVVTALLLSALPALAEEPEASTLVASRSRVHAVLDAMNVAESRLVSCEAAIDELVRGRTDLGAAERAELAAIAAELVALRQAATEAAARVDAADTEAGAAEAEAASERLLESARSALRRASAQVASVRQTLDDERAVVERRAQAEWAWHDQTRRGGHLLVAGTGVLVGAAVAGVVGAAHARPTDGVCAIDPVQCPIDGSVYLPAVALGAVGVGLAAGGVRLMVTAEGPARFELEGSF